MPLADEDRIEIASLIDAAMKAGGTELDNKLSNVLDAIKSCTDAVGAMQTRLDTADKARKDAGDVRRLRAKDAEPGEPEPLAADGMTLTDVQLRADSISHLFGEQAPPPMSGETVKGYRRRLAKHFRKYSKEYAGVDLDTIAAPEAFKAAETVIYAAADSVGRSPPTVPPGRLFMREKKIDGHIVREFFGSPATWMDDFAGPHLRGTGTFKTPGGGN